MVQRMNRGLALPATTETKPGDQPSAMNSSGTINTVLGVSGGLTLVLDGEVGGDQRWDLTSDVCAVDLPPVFGPVVLDHLGLPNTPVPR